MLDVFSATLGAMLTMLLCMIVGFVLRKKAIVPEGADTILSRLLSFVISPALTFHTFLNNFNVQSLLENYTIILFSCLILALALLITGPLSRLFVKEGYAKGIYQYAIVFANCGYMGNAVVLALFGSEALYYYLLFTMPMNIVIYSWGISRMIPGTNGFKGTVKRLLNPVTISLLAGMLAGLLNLKAVFPAFIADALSDLGSCMGPVSMVLTGYVVGMFNLKKALSNGRIYVVSVLRLLILPAIYCGILMLLGASNTVLLCCLIAYAMPLGLNTVVYPAAYGADTSIGASMALISNALCILTFPLMYALLNLVIG